MSASLLFVGLAFTILSFKQEEAIKNDEELIE